MGMERFNCTSAVEPRSLEKIQDHSVNSIPSKPKPESSCVGDCAVALEGEFRSQLLHKGKVKRVFMPASSACASYGYSHAPALVRNPVSACPVATDVGDGHLGTIQKSSWVQEVQSYKFPIPMLSVESMGKARTVDYVKDTEKFTEPVYSKPNSNGFNCTLRIMKYEPKMLTLVDGNGGRSSKTNFYKTKIAKHSQDEIEQFSLRLSTALRRNRNLDSASSILFTKVSRKPLIQKSENGNGFPTEIFSKEMRLQGSVEEKETEGEEPETEPRKNTKDSWSLNACLSEINSISYAKFSAGSKSKVLIKQEVNLSLSNEDARLPLSMEFIQNETQVKEFERPKSNNRRHSVASTTYSSEEELLFDENESVGSAASSISWAPDAVEAKLTLQLARLWEDIELVCSEQIVEKPKGMSHSVYEECLLWKRAFPEKSERPSRFSTMAIAPEDEEDSDSTPTPTNGARTFDFDSPPVSAKCRPSSLRKYPDMDDYYDLASRADNCATPNPSNSTEYVSAWLTHNQTFGQQKPGDEMSLIREDISEEMYRSQIKSPLLPTIQFRNMLQGNVVGASRPLSSTSVGHLITPIPTGNVPVQRIPNDTCRGIRANSPKHGSGSMLPHLVDVSKVGIGGLPLAGKQEAAAQLGSPKFNVPIPRTNPQMNHKIPGPDPFTHKSALQNHRSSIRRRNSKIGELGEAPKETPFLQWLLDSER